MQSLSTNDHPPALSVVVSVFNEEAVLERFYCELAAVADALQVSAEFILVNDGSSDRSAEILGLLALRDSRVKVVNLSRNFGHEAAMIAGLDYSRGQAVVCMDADLQHPPAKIREILEKFGAGFEVVCMKREEAENRPFWHRLKSRLFYRVLNLLASAEFEANASDFFMVSRRVADVLKVEYRERIRFLRGYVQTMGFRKTVISYRAGVRPQGESKYTLAKLCGLSLNAFFNFSNLPLRLGIVMGLAVGAFSTLVGIYSIVMKFVGNAPSGYTTIVVLVSFLFAIQFLIIGIIGEYIGVILIQSRERPIYLVDTTRNIGTGHAE
jgi:polyisoprenyl-phosphate glycosyltransferase